MGDRENYRPGLGRNQSLVDQLKEFQKNPKSLIFVSLAESYRLEGLPQQALEILEEGLAFHPNLTSAVLAKARCLFDGRRYAEALAECQAAIQQNPANLKAYKLQAEVYVRLGQRRAAIRALTKVVSLFPQDLEAVRALEELENLENKQNIPVERISRASTDAAPPIKGKIEEFQVESFRDSINAIPDEARETETEIEMDRYHFEHSTSAEAEDSEPTFATRTIAELYLRQGLKQKAIRVLRKILREDAGNSWARETLQDLESNGIVLRESPRPARREDSLEKRAKFLEKILAQVRLMKRTGA